MLAWSVTIICNLSANHKEESTKYLQSSSQQKQRSNIFPNPVYDAITRKWIWKQGSFLCNPAKHFSLDWHHTFMFHVLRGCCKVFLESHQQTQWVTLSSSWRGRCVDGGDLAPPGTMWSLTKPLWSASRIGSCFCVNTQNATPLMIKKKSEISVLTVKSIELIVSHFIEQHSWKWLLAHGLNVSVKNSSGLVSVMEQ